MLKHANRRWPALFAVYVLLLSCDPDDHLDDLPEVAMATGAEVILTLENRTNCQGIVARQCLLGMPSSVIDARIAKTSIVSLDDVDFDGNTHQLQLALKAKKTGRTKLTVDYEDTSGQHRRAGFALRVADIHEVTLHGQCDDDGHEGMVFPVTTGSELTFSHRAFDRMGNQLATGQMEVIKNFGGLKATAPPLKDGLTRQITVPDAPGTYTLKLKGEASETVKIIVFSPGKFDLRLTEIGTTDAATGFKLERMVDGAPLCVHDGEAFAEIAVDGACRPMVDGIELAGPFLLDVADRNVALDLSGRGACVVHATVLDGKRDTLSVTVNNPAPEPAAGTGEPLGETPIQYQTPAETFGTCKTTRNLSNGKCEVIGGDGAVIPDADCFFDVIWNKNHHDDYDRLSGATVGVGLMTMLRVKIEYVLFGFISLGDYSPNDLVVEVPPGVTVTYQGCNSGNSEVLAMTPDTGGDHTLTLSAKNAFDDTRFTLKARPIATLLVDLGTTEAPFVADSRETDVFVGNRVSPVLGYLDASGNPLHGRGPLQASSDVDSTGATLGPRGIDTGERPNTILLTSPFATQVHRINVVDGTGIAGIKGAEDIGMSPGEVHCIEMTPLCESGAEIFGDSPVRPSIGLAKSRVLAVMLPADGTGGLCLTGVDDGSAEVTYTFGSAETTRVWTVQ